MTMAVPVPARRELRFALPAALLLAAIGVGLLVANLVLNLSWPASIPNPQNSADALIPGLAMVAVAFLISTRQPANPVGWLVSAGAIALGLLLVGSSYMNHLAVAHDVPDAPALPLGFLSIVGWSTGFPALLILLPLVFPDGHLISRRWRAAVWLSLVTMLFTVITSVLGSGSSNTPTFMDWLNGPVSGLFMALLMVSAFVSLVLRYRQSGPELRHQLKWFIAAIGLGVITVIPNLAGFSSGLANAALAVGLTAVPAGIGISVLKYRLYDIDIVINRALVYGALAAFITAIYVGIVVGIGSLIGGSGKPNLVLSILATAVVAVAFQPVRERVQRVANRLVYGRRATPYEVLSEFSERVAESYAGEEVLQRMAGVLAEGTGAQRAEVWLRGGNLIQMAAAWPEGGATKDPVVVTGDLLPALVETDRVVAVRNQGELLGALSVSKRKGESLTPIEEKLLADLAHQAGLVLKNVGLTNDLRARLVELRASRQRLVAAQDHERRRIERNLHDGAQQHLVALKVKLGLAELQSAKDPDKARATLAQLKTDAGEALETLRDLARGIYPPLLAEQGLAAALRSQAAKATLPVEVDSDGVGRYPQEVESAVYFCCLEALQNVQKYSGASGACIKLSDSGGGLSFRVEDDGKGFDTATARRGSGLQNMADRLDAIGGKLTIESSALHGTRVDGTMPVAV